MAFTHVQGANATYSGVTSFTFALTSNPTAGNLVCIAMAYSNAPSRLTSVVDANGNQYTLVNSTEGLNGGFGVRLAYLVKAPANASKTITVSFSQSETGDCFCDEFHVAAGSIVLSVVSASGSGSATAINLPSITPGSTGELLYAAVSVNGTITAPAAGGTAGVWTGCTGNGLGQGMGGEYDLSASTATPVNFTQTPSAVWAGLAMSFKNVTAGGHIQLEGGTGNVELEDLTGDIKLEF